jgi:hypothetical protein
MLPRKLTTPSVAATNIFRVDNKIFRETCKYRTIMLFSFDKNGIASCVSIKVFYWADLRTPAPSMHHPPTPPHPPTHPRPPTRPRPPTSQRPPTSPRILTRPRPPTRPRPLMAPRTPTLLWIRTEPLPSPTDGYVDRVSILTDAENELWKTFVLPFFANAVFLKGTQAWIFFKSFLQKQKPYGPKGL